jgi:HAD superfamily hydrolase (TIGR01484 family)
VSGPLLLCTDLDRTLLPNGEPPESDRARPLFRRLCDREDVTLVYVTGRDTARVAAAIREYDLPVPDQVIADVGTTIATPDGVRLEAWDEHIAFDWGGRAGTDLQVLVGEKDGLVLQEISRQGRHKLSYEVHEPALPQTVAAEIAELLRDAGLAVAVVPSYDDVTRVGLIDVLPGRAGKGPAIDFLRDHLGLRVEDTVFAGDSGNDLDVLAGPLPAVLVANATDEVRRRAVREAEILGNADRLHLARGGVLGMNGNYAAGILEGVLHFQPQWEKVL